MAVEPPDVTCPHDVVRRERVPLLVVRRRTDEVFGAGMGQSVNSAFEAELGERLRLAVARPKAGAPQEALRLRDAERLL